MGYYKEVSEGRQTKKQRGADSKHQVHYVHLHNGYGKAEFCYYDPTAWNKLPLYLRKAVSVDSFKAQLKTYFFTLAFSGV